MALSRMWFGGDALERASTIVGSHKHGDVEQVYCTDAADAAKPDVRKSRWRDPTVDAERMPLLAVTCF